MVRRPDDPNPDPPGGRAAERLREFLEGRFPNGEVPIPDGAAGRPGPLPDESAEPPPPTPPTDLAVERERPTDAADATVADDGIDAGPPRPRIPDDR